jgi:hypothetical protein
MKRILCRGVCRWPSCGLRTTTWPRSTALQPGTMRSLTRRTACCGTMLLTLAERCIDSRPSRVQGRLEWGAVIRTRDEGVVSLGGGGGGGGVCELQGVSSFCWGVRTSRSRLRGQQRKHSCAKHLDRGAISRCQVFRTDRISGPGTWAVIAATNAATM